MIIFCVFYTIKIERIQHFNSVDLLVAEIIRIFCPRAGPSLQGSNLGCSSAQRQVFYRKLGNQSCSSLKWCGSFPLLSALHSLFNN